MQGWEGSGHVTRKRRITLCKSWLDFGPKIFDRTVTSFIFFKKVFHFPFFPLFSFSLWKPLVSLPSPDGTCWLSRPRCILGQKAFEKRERSRRRGSFVLAEGRAFPPEEFWGPPLSRGARVSPSFPVTASMHSFLLLPFTSLLSRK